MNEALSWLPRPALLLLPLLAGAAAVWWMLPRPHRRRPLTGVLFGLAAMALLGVVWLPPSGKLLHDLPFYLFAGTAVGSAVLMITDRDPVHAALWFALTTLAVCGLFLLRSATFLAAATTIVYAGAIVVTFLFVIMLARQAGEALYDRQAAQPLAATAVALVLLAGILYSLETWRGGEDALDGLAVRQGSERTSDVSPRRFLPPPEALRANALSDPADGTNFGTLRGLGRSLFGDYLLAVEVAGTLLVAAAVGAIAIAPRTPRGTL
jgi:NADH-quinone oxidoreductase subunit J